MKNITRIFFALLCAGGLGACLSSAPVDAAHNSRNSLNWEGLYTGTIPAASSPGISVRLTLNRDETFTISYQYIDRPEGDYSGEGKFTWNSAGNTITLETGDFPPYYLVGENRLTQLDMQGQPITGTLADNYVLTKE
jgi:uncharacterized lipoprotein NlpE involved in copper resistance